MKKISKKRPSNSGAIGNPESKSLSQNKKKHHKFPSYIKPKIELLHSTLNFSKISSQIYLISMFEAIRGFKSNQAGEFAVT